MLTLTFVLSFGLFLVPLLVWYWLGYRPYRVWTKLRVPGPPPSFFWGNTQALRSKGMLQCYREWKGTYGDVSGYYLGAQPVLLVTDLEMLKHIMVKEFDSFADRSANFFSVLSGARKKVPYGLVSSKGDQWKRMRHIVSPSFSSRKLKLMAPLVEIKCNRLCDEIATISTSDEVVDVFKLFGQFTMETILAAAFGCEVGVMKGEADTLPKAAAEIFTGGKKLITDQEIIGTFTSQFPFLIPILKKVISFTSIADVYTVMIEAALSIVDARRKMAIPPKEKDLLQLLLEASADENDEPVCGTDTGSEGRIVKKTLTDMEIVGLSVGFLLAGYETTSNLLTYTAYLLATNTHEQDKLCSEIDECFQENKDIPLHEAAQKISYLDWVIQESLRLFPPGARTFRSCNKEACINGVTIPKDTMVVIPIDSIHHDPKLWPDPETFRPRRFSPEEKEGRNPLAHMPFGLGPRNCIGMRFALMEAKMALTKILKDYTFVCTPKTQIPLKTAVYITLMPVDGVFLAIQPRLARTS